MSEQTVTGAVERTSGVVRMIEQQDFDALLPARNG